MFNFDFKFLSPYSYMLRPIENAFSKVKSCVRSRLRNNENGVLSDIIMSETNNITSTDCNGYFRYIYNKYYKLWCGTSLLA
uniref:DDE_3 domain-containing protein n=1 Tax=Strongyloides papillosus TaxID=174720 RepID=A0A0N5BZS1_STREA